MKGKTHIVIGAAAGVTIALNTEIDNGLLVLLGSTVGSLVPDIDHPKSKINQKLLRIKNKSFKIMFYCFLGIILLFLYTEYNEKVFLLSGITLILTGVSRHRGFTHSILGALLYINIVKSIGDSYGYEDIYIGFVGGYLSHLISDFFTKGGIEIFYPFSENFSFPISIKTGGVMENFIVFMAGMYSIYIVLKYIGFINC